MTLLRHRRPSDTIMQRTAGPPEVDLPFMWRCGVLLSLSFLVGVLAPICELLRHIPSDYNEGWNAYWAHAAWQGGYLYPKPGSAVVDNYPPLSFYLVGALGGLLGDDIWAGRIIALLSLLLLPVDIFALLASFEIEHGICIFAAALFGAVFVVLAPDYVAMDDPQLLGQALILTALTVMCRQRFNPTALAIGALLMMLGGLTKQLLIATPIAVTLWMGARCRHRLVWWLLAGVVSTALASVVLQLCFGRLIFEDLISPRTYSQVEALKGTFRALRHMPLMPLFVAFTIPIAFSRNASKGMRDLATFASIYGMVATAIGIFASGGAGVDKNAFFDLAIAGCLAGAAVLQYLSDSEPVISHFRSNSGLTTVLVGTCAVFYTVHAVRALPEDWQRARTAGSREQAAMSLIQHLRVSGTSKVACETLSLCYWAGAPFVVDFFNLGQELATHTVAARYCSTDFENAVEIMEVDDPHTGQLSRRLPPECDHAIAARYQPISTFTFGTLMQQRR